MSKCHLNLIATYELPKLKKFMLTRTYTTRSSGGRKKKLTTKEDIAKELCNYMTVPEIECLDKIIKTGNVELQEMELDSTKSFVETGYVVLKDDGTREYYNLLNICSGQNCAGFSSALLEPYGVRCAFPWKIRPYGFSFDESKCDCDGDHPNKPNCEKLSPSDIETVIRDYITFLKGNTNYSYHYIVRFIELMLAEEKNKMRVYQIVWTKSMPPPHSFIIISGITHMPQVSLDDGQVRTRSSRPASESDESAFPRNVISIDENQHSPKKLQYYSLGFYPKVSNNWDSGIGSFVSNLTRNTLICRE